MDVLNNGNNENLERLVGKILANQENLKEMLEKHFEEDRILAGRVSSIESRMSWAAGALAVLVVVWGFLSESIAKALGLR